MRAGRALALLFEARWERGLAVRCACPGGHVVVRATEPREAQAGWLTPSSTAADLMLDASPEERDAVRAGLADAGGGGAGDVEDDEEAGEDEEDVEDSVAGMRHPAAQTAGGVVSRLSYLCHANPRHMSKRDRKVQRADFRALHSAVVVRAAACAGSPQRSRNACLSRIPMCSQDGSAPTESLQVAGQTLVLTSWVQVCRTVQKRLV